MAAKIKQGYRLTQEHYAYIYGVHPNTIHRWQKRHFSLDDPVALIREVLLAFGPKAFVTLRKGTKAIVADYNELARE